MIKIAIDGMGGDRSPLMVIGGILRAAQRYPDVHFVLFGNRDKIQPLLAKKHFAPIIDRVDIIHTDEIVTMDEAPANAIRRGRNSSMGLALNALREKQVDCVISAGNTGALMGMAKIMIKVVEGIERPAMASLCPTMRGETVMLDLGANISATPYQLEQFALMGKIFANATLGIEKPTIGLLNIGSEALKGPDEVRAAAALLEKIPETINYTGFVEANEIVAGKVDVVVMNGYGGNIALKAMEGVANFLMMGLKNVYSANILSKFAFFLIRGPMKHFFHRVDPRVHNGAVFLGLNGIVVKSHGGTDSLGFAHAISVGIDTVQHGFLAKVNAELPSLMRDESNE